MGSHTWGRRSLVGAVLGLVIVLVVQGPVWAAPGDPDTGFDTDGLATFDFPGGFDNQADAVLVQANGRIVLGGYSRPDGGDFDFGLVRLLGNGTIDTSFSGDGFRTLDVRGVGGIDRIWDLAQQPDGKIVAVGHAENADGTDVRFAVVRFKANGTLDATFSGDGKLLVSFPGLDEAWGYAVAIQEDGKILVGGEAGDSSPAPNWDFAVVRINANGTIDTTYGGGDGRVLTDFAGEYDGIWDMVLQDDGKLVTAGWSRNAAADRYRFAFARYKTGGGLDQMFSGDGKQTVQLSPTGSDSAFGVEVRGDGKIVAAGSASTPDVALVRLTPGGVLDTTFTGDGKLISEPVPEGVYIRDLDLAGGNKLIVSGNTTGDDFFVARYTPGGALDATFGGGDGVVVTVFPGATDSTVKRSTIQPNGRILVAGWADMAADDDFAVGRFLP